METLRIVNKALDGEPQHIVLQNIETNETFEFSKIAGETINDNDLNHPVIQQILNSGHFVQGSINDGIVTLHF